MALIRDQVQEKRGLEQECLGLGFVVVLVANRSDGMLQVARVADCEGIPGEFGDLAFISMISSAERYWIISGFSPRWNVCSFQKFNPALWAHFAYFPAFSPQAHKLVCFEFSINRGWG